MDWIQLQFVIWLLNTAIRSYIVNTLRFVLKYYKKNRLRLVIV